MKKNILFIALSMSMLGGSIIVPLTAIAESQFVPVFVRQLRRGMTGDDIKTLQELLASDPEVYPEGLVTGFFGPLTENAVRRFQKKHGIEQVGQIGPRTRARLHAFLEERVAQGKKLPPGLMRIGAFATSTATSTQGKGELKVAICHKPAGESPHMIVVGIPALAAHIMHGDTIGACPAGGAGPADLTAPLISGVAATSIGSTSAHITWITNENSDSRVWYTTSTPVATSTAMTAVNAALIVSHDVLLSGLTASTTYYYKVGSADASGNEAISSELSFVTLP